MKFYHNSSQVMLVKFLPLFFYFPPPPSSSSPLFFSYPPLSHSLCLHSFPFLSPLLHPFLCVFLPFPFSHSSSHSPSVTLHSLLSSLHEIFFNYSQFDLILRRLKNIPVDLRFCVWIFNRKIHECCINLAYGFLRVTFDLDFLQLSNTNA